MRILHLTRDFPPENRGGLSTAVGGMVSALSAAGVHSAVVSYDAWRPTSKSAGAPSEREGVLRVSAPAHRGAVLAAATRFQPDVIHVHDPLLFDDALAMPGPRVYTVHVAHAVLGRLRGLSEPTLSEIAERRALDLADATVVPCRAVGDDLGLESAHVVPFGVEVPAWAPAPRRSVLFAGRLADVKGVDDLFSAMERVIAARPETELSVAGGLALNPKAERRVRERFEAKASPALREATTWLGWLSPAELAAWYRRAAVLAAPSWYETCGLAVLEAMAHGVAVVASDVAGLAAQIVHGRTGWLVPPRQSEALAEAILALLTAPARARSLGDAAAAHVARERPWARLIGGQIDVYRACCSHSPKPVAP